MKIHELSTEAGLVPVELRALANGGFAVVTGGAVEALPDGAIEAVMKRFGRPLDPDVDLIEVASLVFSKAKLRHVRHLARYDVIARDFLVFEHEGDAPLCALATIVAGALAHLAKSHALRAPSRA